MSVASDEERTRRERLTPARGRRRLRAQARSTIRILLVDDHPLVREGLKRILSSMVGVVIVGEAASGEEAVDRAIDLQPDLVVMDLSLPGMSGIEAVRVITVQCPETRVLALTMHADEQYVRGALEAGASGYVVKDARPSDLVAAIEAVHRGEQYVMAGGVSGRARKP